MATPTGTMPGCICPTATYPLPLPTASAPLQSFWAPATLGIWAGSIASIFILIYTIVKVAPSRRAKLFGMDETILQLSLRALLVPQECTPQNSISVVCDLLPQPNKSLQTSRSLRTIAEADSFPSRHSATCPRVRPKYDPRQFQPIYLRRRSVSQL